MSGRRDSGGGGANFLLGLILLSLSGVPVLSIGGSILGGALLLAGVGIAAVWQWLLAALALWALVRLVRWFISQRPEREAAPHVMTDAEVSAMIRGAKP